jgi:hypothetical protein
VTRMAAAAGVQMMLSTSRAPTICTDTAVEGSGRPLVAPDDGLVEDHDGGIPGSCACRIGAAGPASAVTKNVHRSELQ